MKLRTVLLFSLVLVGCGGAAASGVPAASGHRESGQSRLMDDTYAGKNRCSAKNNDRPFVIEWDATDMSSFESRANSDVVVVKYEGCDLEVLDHCNVDSLKGANGAYAPPEWTSGSVEKIDIKNEGELYAKLPLGAATLGGRVQGGEAFHMEYYVAGTRKATRDEVYRADLDKIPGCRGATHFVYAYNLGAFALGSASETHAEVGATVWGIGAGANKKALNSAEKKGGVLTSCTGETAKESSSCRVPIRVTLRAISDGENPDAVAARAPETTSAKNLAGKVDHKLKMNTEAQQHYSVALEKQRAGDGRGCLRELDARDRLDPIPENQSTNPHSFNAQTRAQCVMLSGQCDAGKALMRRAYLATLANQVGPEQVDNLVDTMAGDYCRGGSMTPRDQVIAASKTLARGAQSKVDVSVCANAWNTISRVGPTVKSRGDDDWAYNSASDLRNQKTIAAMCYGRAGDCDTAFSLLGATNNHAIYYQVVPACRGK